jgi:hypothetical protein
MAFRFMATGMPQSETPENRNFLQASGGYGVQINDAEYQI